MRFCKIRGSQRARGRSDVVSIGVVRPPDLGTGSLLGLGYHCLASVEQGLEWAADLPAPHNAMDDPLERGGSLDYPLRSNARGRWTIRSNFVGGSTRDLPGLEIALLLENSSREKKENRKKKNLYDGACGSSRIVDDTACLATTIWSRIR